MKVRNIEHTRTLDCMNGSPYMDTCAVLDVLASVFALKMWPTWLYSVIFQYNVQFNTF